MQPIALNIQVLEQLIDNWSDVKSQREFHKLAENLENYHCIFIDKKDHRSVWLENLRSLRNNIKDSNIKKIFDDLIGPKNIKYKPVDVEDNQDLLISIAQKTPDKIGLNTKKLRSNDLRFYDLKTFNTNEFDTTNYLFRIPKVVTIKPGERFDDLRLFSPYLRDANKIEFCDLYLFKSNKSESEITFITELIGLAGKPSEVIIHCEPNPLNVIQKKSLENLHSTFGKSLSVEYKKYNPPTRDVNHDRFIIVDHNKYSIRFTTSFNNLKQSSKAKFEAKDSFLIEFSCGRKYFDE